MKRIIYAAFILFASCHNRSPIVNSVFIDSLITHYKEPVIFQLNETEMQFWKKRMDSLPSGMTNEQKYANTLLTRFHLYGDINDVRSADSLMQEVDNHFGKTESPISLTLAGYSILQHQFKTAKDYVWHAKETGCRKYPLLLSSFDVYFELGQYDSAAMMLRMIKGQGDYNYYFRLSKLQHLKGSIDSAIQSMMKAAGLSNENNYLKQVALSNAADLCIHAGKLQKANNLYMECIRLNAADFHSLMGLGWIALVHDKNDSLANKIFQFAHTKLKSPDPLLKLAQTAENKNDSLLTVKYANAFIADATKPVYGDMYNKYLIDLYTGILHEPSKAAALAEKEIGNRPTPQTYAWYVWSLYADHKPEEAYKMYQQKVSGKPLEGLELYWMGKFMKGLNKGYNAEQFFDAAYNNRYDLDPDKQKDLE